MNSNKVIEELATWLADLERVVGAVPSVRIVLALLIQDEFQPEVDSIITGLTEVGNSLEKLKEAMRKKDEA